MREELPGIGRAIARLLPVRVVDRMFGPAYLDLYEEHAAGRPSILSRVVLAGRTLAMALECAARAVAERPPRVHVPPGTGKGIDPMIGQDLRFAVRALWKSRGFTIAAVLVLAIGTGASTAMFSVVRAVLLEPLPYADAHRLVDVTEAARGRPVAVSPPNFVDWEAQNQTFSQLVAYNQGTLTLSGKGEPERLDAAYVGAAFVDALGVKPLLGRGFVPDESREGGPRVVILGHALWERRYGSDAAIVGRTIAVDSVPHLVVGVMPAGFAFGGADLWVPLVLTSGDTNPNQRGAHYISAVGRLAPGVSIRAGTSGPEPHRAGHRRGVPRQGRQLLRGRGTLVRLHRRRRAQAVVAAARRGAVRPSHCLRERLEPASRARDDPPGGNRRPLRAGRRTLAHRPAAAGGEYGAVGRWRRRRRGARGLGRPQPRRCPSARPATQWRHRDRYARAGVCDDCLARHGDRLRSGAGTPCVGCRPGDVPQGRAPRWRCGRGPPRPAQRAGRRRSRSGAGAARGRRACAPELRLAAPGQPGIRCVRRSERERRAPRGALSGCAGGRPVLSRVPGSDPGTARDPIGRFRHDSAARGFRRLRRVVQHHRPHARGGAGVHAGASRDSRLFRDGADPAAPRPRVRARRQRGRARRGGDQRGGRAAILARGQRAWPAHTNPRRYLRTRRRARDRGDRRRCEDRRSRRGGPAGGLRTSRAVSVRRHDALRPRGGGCHLARPRDQIGARRDRSRRGADEDPIRRRPGLVCCRRTAIPHAPARIVRRARIVARGGGTLRRHVVFGEPATHGDWPADRPGRRSARSRAAGVAAGAGAGGGRDRRGRGRSIGAHPTRCPASCTRRRRPIRRSLRPSSSCSARSQSPPV